MQFQEDILAGGLLTIVESILDNKVVTASVVPSSSTEFNEVLLSAFGIPTGADSSVGKFSSGLEWEQAAKFYLGPLGHLYDPESLAQNTGLDPDQSVEPASQAIVLIPFAEQAEILARTGGNLSGPSFYDVSGTVDSEGGDDLPANPGSPNFCPRKKPAPAEQQEDQDQAEMESLEQQIRELQKKKERLEQELKELSQHIRNKEARNLEERWPYLLVSPTFVILETDDDRRRLERLPSEIEKLSAELERLINDLERYQFHDVRDQVGGIICLA